MKRYVVIMILVGVLALPSAVSAQGEILYGCTSLANEETSMLYLLDPSTGEATLVGDMGMEMCTGLAFDSNGNLFASGRLRIDQFTTPAALYAVNRLTGAATPIGAMGPHSWGNSVPDLSFRSDDVLFAYLHGEGISDGLGTVNTATGELTEIGATHYYGPGNGIAFNGSDVLFHSHWIGGLFGLQLFTLDQGTGHTTELGELNVPGVYCPDVPRINAMDFNSADTLYGSLNCGSGYGEAVNYLVTIDTTTMDITLMGPTVDRLDGIAFLPPPPPPPPEEEFVPEWGSIALLGSGLMGLAGYASLRWRKR